MRRDALRVASVALLVLVAAAAERAQPAGAQTPVNLTVQTEHYAVMVPGPPGKAGRLWGYWGRFTGTESGSYRGTCAWLADPSWGLDPTKRDWRYLCTVVLSFRARAQPPGPPIGGSLIAQGLINRPHAPDGLFAQSSDRPVAITGGAGRYKGRYGWATLNGGTINIVLV
jgi:hypothetical protein